MLQGREDKSPAEKGEKGKMRQRAIYAKNFWAKRLTAGQKNLHTRSNSRGGEDQMQEITTKVAKVMQKCKKNSKKTRTAVF